MTFYINIKNFMFSKKHKVFKNLIAPYNKYFFLLYL